MSRRWGNAYARGRPAFEAPDLHVGVGMERIDEAGLARAQTAREGRLRRPRLAFRLGLAFWLYVRSEVGFFAQARGGWTGS